VQWYEWCILDGLKPRGTVITHRLEPVEYIKHNDFKSVQYNDRYDLDAPEIAV